MQEKSRVNIAIILSFVLVVLATLIWANQTGKINIWGAGEVVAIVDKFTPTFGQDIYCGGDGLFFQMTTAAAPAPICGKAKINGVRYAASTISTLIPMNTQCSNDQWINAYIGPTGPKPGKEAQWKCIDLIDPNGGKIVRGYTTVVERAGEPISGYGACPENMAAYGFSQSASKYTTYCSALTVQASTPAPTPTSTSGGTITLNGSAVCIKDGSRPVNHLTWNSYPGASGYTIFRDSTALIDLTTSTTGWDDYTMGSGSHFYQVSPKNTTGGYFGNSNVVYLTTQTCTPITTQSPTPTSTTSSNWSFKLTSTSCSGSNQIYNFSWTSAPGQTQYLLAARATPTDSGSAVQVTGNNGSWNSSSQPQMYTPSNSLYFDLFYETGTAGNVNYADADCSGQGYSCVPFSVGKPHYGIAVPSLKCGSPQPDPNVCPYPGHPTCPGYWSFWLNDTYCSGTNQVYNFSWTSAPGQTQYILAARPESNGVGSGVDVSGNNGTWNSSTQPQWYTTGKPLYFDLFYGTGNFADANGEHPTGHEAIGPINPPGGTSHYGFGVQNLKCNQPSPDTQPPTTPTNLTAQAQSQTEIQLNWTASTDNIGVAGYEIYNADTNQMINSTANNSWKVTGATCNTTYKYYVKAYDAAGNKSANSNTATATTQACGGQDTQAPTKPTNLAADPSIGCHEIKLTWIASTDNVGVSGYSIYNAKDNKIITTIKENTYTFKDLTENTDYQYYIKAQDAAGNSSEQSETVTTKTKTCPKPEPSKPAVDSLIKTGSVLWFNILIALVIAGIASYLLLRKRQDY